MYRYLQIGGAVHLGSIVELIRDLGEVFLQQIDVKHRRYGGQDKPGEGVAQIQVGDRHEVGDDHQLVGYHHQGEKQGEYQIFAA